MLLPELYSLLMAPLLRAFLMLLGSTTGVWIRFEKVRGDFFSYRVCLDGVEIDVSQHLRCAVRHCTLEFSLLDISLDTLIVSNVQIEGARLEYEHVPGQALIPRTLPPFLIKTLTLRDAEVVFTDASRAKPAKVQIHLDDYRCEAIHSQSLLFDALFTARLKGRFAGAPLTMQYAEQGPKCQSEWAIKGLPLRRLAPFVDGRLDLFETGSVDVLVSNDWRLDKDELTLNVQVWLGEMVNFSLPTALPAPTRALADALRQVVKRQTQALPLSFQFRVRKADFMDLTHIDAGRIITAFTDGLTQAILDKSLQNVDQIWDVGLQGLNTLLDIKKFFDF